MSNSTAEAPARPSKVRGHRTRRFAVGLVAAAALAAPLAMPAVANAVTAKPAGTTPAEAYLSFNSVHFYPEDLFGTLNAYSVSWKGGANQIITITLEAEDANGIRSDDSATCKGNVTSCERELEFYTSTGSATIWLTASSNLGQRSNSIEEEI